MWMILLFSLSVSAEMITGSLECKAIYRSVEMINGKEKFIDEEALMPITFAQFNTVKYEVDLGKKYFSLTEDKLSNSLLANITTAPDYIKGSLTRGTTDDQGRFNLSTVDGVTVHRMECKRLPEVKPQRLGL
jgi:hypothetical protein